MALEKKITYDYQVNKPYNVISVREKTAIMEDGVQLSASYKRRTIQPSDDVSEESSEVKALTEAMFTDEIKKAWDDSLKESKE
tara:strand:+ start:945 stop:1193 length:249 start_codon:yes stop_codon:yes gene_type:complete